MTTKVIARIAAQIFGVMIIVAACTYVTGLANYKGIYNSIWGFLLPAFIAVMCNKQKPTQVMMAVILMAISFMVCGVAGVLFGFY